VSLLTDRQTHKLVTNVPLLTDNRHTKTPLTHLTNLNARRKTNWPTGGIFSRVRNLFTNKGILDLKQSIKMMEILANQNHSDHASNCALACTYSVLYSAFSGVLMLFHSLLSCLVCSRHSSAVDALLRCFLRFCIYRT
jgi:hypothetical protein